MSKVCKHHAEHPVKIYSQCIGCELEMLHSENERQKAENVRLVDALRLYADRDVLVKLGLGGERDART